MANWQQALMEALNTGNPDIMRAALENAPPFAAQMATQIVKSQAHAHFDKKAWQQALDYYDQVVVLDNKDYYVFLRRAECLLRLDRLDEAGANAAQCVEMSGDKFDGHELLGRIFLERKDQARALVCFQKAAELKPRNKEVQKRIAFIEKQMAETEENLQKVLNPEQNQEEPQPLPPRPEVSFNPQLLFEKPRTASFKDSAMYGGLRHFLNAHGNLQHPGKVLARLEDQAWLEPWLDALDQAKGKRALFWGAEGGVLPLKALDQGAEALVIWESHAFAARLADGVIGKNMLMKWRAQQGKALEDLSDEEKKASFEAFTSNITFLEQEPEALEAAKTPEPCHQLYFTHLDHSLLGTGMVEAIELCRGKLLASDAEIFPSQATVYAMGVEWDYTCDKLNLNAFNPFRWNAHPEKVDLNKYAWRALTEPCEVARIHLADFSENVSQTQLPVVENGSLHGVIFWYQLQLGSQTLSNEPNGALSALGQAYQYVDPIFLKKGESCQVEVQIQKGKVGFQTTPPISREKSQILPRWLFSSAQDQNWNQPLRKALSKALDQNKPKNVLCLGAGNGVIPITSAQSGAETYVCELSGNLAQVLESNASANGVGDRVNVLNKDCRQAAHPDDLPQKADMIVFDLFDCGLLGEGVLHYLEHALEHLTTEDVKVFPQAATLKAVLIERRLEDVAGYDATLMTPYLFSPEYSQVDLNQIAWRALSDPFDVFSFNFSEAKKDEETATLKPTLTADGVLGAVAFWYELRLDEETTLTTSPFVKEHCRWQALQYLPEINVKTGMEVVLDVKHTGSNVIFALNKDHVDKETVVNLPRFDPRWMSMHMQLANQGGQMMQQIHAHPEEYKKVVAMASKMAAQPASVGLEPDILSRFLESFMLS